MLLITSTSLLLPSWLPLTSTSCRKTTGRPTKSSPTAGRSWGHGDLETAAIGDLETAAIGDLETTAIGNIETAAIGSLETTANGNLDIAAIGDT